MSIDIANGKLSTNFIRNENTRLEILVDRLELALRNETDRRKALEKALERLSSEFRVALATIENGQG